MDNYKTLLEKGEYELVEQLTRTSKKPKELLYRLSALLSLSRYEEAVDILVSDRDILWKENPVLTLKVNFEVRFALKEFDEAYEDLEYFQNLPYVRQEVEEVLRALPKAIREEERDSRPASPYEQEEIERIFASPKGDYELLGLLNYLRSHNAGDYKKEIREVASSPNRHSDLKTFALLILLSLGDASPLEFSKNGKTYKVVPSSLIPPFGDKEYAAITSYLSGYKDASLGRLAASIVNETVMALYPESLNSLGSIELIEDASLALASSYLHVAAKPATAKMTKAMEAMEKLLKENPPLTE